MEYELKTSTKFSPPNTEHNVHKGDLTLAFDVGHSSIGWAVLMTPGPEILGTGAVTFPADDCLASARRLYRRQRRHVRSTRQRIARMEKLLVHLGVFSETDLKQKHGQGGGHPAPWLLAARVLAFKGASESLLNWPDFWNVLRWYAHNRGYDGNRRWAGDENAHDDEENDTEKVENARALMLQHHAETMAETITAVMFEPHGKLKVKDIDVSKKLPFFTGKSRYKAKSAAFPRDVVESEVRQLLEFHVSKLPHLDARFVSLLCDGIPTPVEESDRQRGNSLRAELKAIGIPLPKRFLGGILFGQLVPRFDNRIISTCAVSGEKVCAKSAPEFRLYRWLMQLANVRVVRKDSSLPPQLIQQERAAINERILISGAFTKGEFKAAVNEVTGCIAHNLDTMLMHPDAEKALVLNPVKKLIGSDRVQFLWPHLPERLQKRATGKWVHGKVLTFQQILSWCDEIGVTDETLLQKARTAQAEKATKKKTTKAKEFNEAEFLAAQLKPEAISGRAPYARHILQKASEEVLLGLDPRKKCKANDPTGGEEKAVDGCLVTSDSMQAKTLNKPLDHLTNNHLVRHRLLILERLTKDIIADPTLVNGQSERIKAVAIEVNRELKEMSGKKAKQVAQDLGLRLGNFKSVVKKLEEAGIEHPSAGLIRKARVAEDLNRTCPYTGRTYDWHDLQNPDLWDKDHVVPYSQRPSNSLDSLVITTKAINLEKKNRTGLEFIEWINQPENLARRDELKVWTPKQYKDFVEGLESWKGHGDDIKRKRRRKQLLLLPKWEEKDAGFLPRDLTVTSHLTRLGALVVQRSIPHLPPHQITSLPGSVTGTIRTGWKLLGCLHAANAGVLDENKQLKNKTDIRSVTHLHHALDAIVIGLTHHYFPKNGRLWEAIVRREKSRNATDNALLLCTGLYHTTQHGVLFASTPPEALRNQIEQKLAERRVVQHLPADMSGMLVEENTRGVERIADDGTVHLKQISRDAKTGKLSVKRTKEAPAKLIGLRPGKLSDQKGVRVISANYGVAILDTPPPKADGSTGEPEDRFVVIPFAGVWRRLQELRKLNGGHTPRVIRNGMIIRISGLEKKMSSKNGFWRVFSVKQSRKLDLGGVDRISMEDKASDVWREVSLLSITPERIEILARNMAGVTTIL
jgi:CRISPR-associated endonuclease Csn1